MKVMDFEEQIAQGVSSAGGLSGYDRYIHKGIGILVIVQYLPRVKNAALALKLNLVYVLGAI